MISAKKCYFHVLFHTLFVTCFTSYRRKSREISVKCLITLYISYSILLCRNLPQDTEQRPKIMKKCNLAEADPRGSSNSHSTRNCECQCEQLATASSLTRNCELGRFDLLIYDVATLHWSREATRICE